MGCVQGTSRLARSETRPASFSAAATDGPAVAAHQRRGQDEVHVVRVVALRVEQAGAAAPEQRLVGRRGLDVRVQALAPAADPVPDVARHVHDVAGARHQRRQPLRVRRRPLGPVRRLDRVDVEVDRAGVVGLRHQRPERAVAEHALDQRDHALGGALRRAPAIGPVVPRAEVHQRVGRQQRHAGVLREARLHRLHRVRVGLVQGLAVGVRVGRVAPRQRLDQRGIELARAGRQAPRLLQHGEGAERSRPASIG